LNNALCKLDFSNLDNFTREQGIIGHLDLYAQCSGARNVAREIYNRALAKAERRIDYEEGFGEFADSLYYNAEQASEVGIPGAGMLCRSLMVLRRRHEGKIGLSFSRLAARIDNVFAEHRDGGQQQLEIRETHKYNGECRDMDEWSDAGNVSVMYRSTKHEDMDGTNGLLFVRVWSGFDDEKIKKALHDTFSYHGCSCEHDCCGCESQYVGHIKCISRERFIWVMRVSTSRNI